MEDLFIGQWDNLLTKRECNQLIQYFEDMKSLNKTFNRQEDKHGDRHKVDDETVFVTEPEEFSFDHTQTAIQPFIQKFWPAYNEYVEKYSVIKASNEHAMLNMRLQKTKPGGGYHVWHYETSSFISSPRFITYMIYLNDVEEGGETEFLYLHKRIKPKAGTLLIWPSGFPHTHRGNTPLTGDKYILTGWLNFIK
jgi:hypothetical protein